MDPAPRTRVRLCGPLALEIDERDVAADLPGGQARALLAHLLARRDRPVERTALIEIVWPTGAPKDPQADLRVILSRLRRALEPGTIEGRDELRLALPGPVWVDVDEAGAAVEAARAATREEAWPLALERAAAGLDLLRPGFLPGQDGDWARDARNELEELELEALGLVARSALAVGGDELATATRAARELVARAPFRESGRRLLMEALAATGNVAEALQAYEELRTLLREELGVAPTAELQELHRRLLGGDVADPTPAATATADAARLPLPAVLSPRRSGELIGREDELERLRGAWRDARAGTRRLVVVGGHAGIGKTRLSSELAREAHAAGTVLYGACLEDALVSYQPFVEALRHYVRARPGGAPAASLGPGAAQLARLIPELAVDAHAGDESPADDPETARWLLFEAVSSLLDEAAGREPVLLIVDDLHWADRPTLRLLRHVARAQQDAALLIVGTYREGELPADHPLFELLADLRRDRLFERVALDGLDRTGVGELIASTAVLEASPALLSAIHEETEGNPFFVEEVMRHLIETGAVFERDGRWASTLNAEEIGVPEGVKEVLDRRLARLSDACRAVLTRAAVLGREFRFDVLARTGDESDDALIDAIEEALTAQLVVEGAPGPDLVHAFTHALVRETLYGALSGPRRQRLHAAAAAAIEAGGPAEADAQVAALAVHHRLAGAAGDPEKAITCSLTAGQRASALFAWEEAAAHWEGALAVMERTGADPAQRARLLVALSDLIAVMGDLGRQIAFLERALALYDGLGDEERAAHVHSRLGMAHSLIDSIYAEHLDIVEAFRHFDAAREVLDRGPVRKARGHLETGVSTALTYGVRIDDGMEAASRAMAIAEELGDEALWAGAVEAFAWHTIVAGRLEKGFAEIERGFEAADRGRHSFLAMMASTIHGQMTWGLGDPDGAQAFLERPFGLAYAGRTAHGRQLADGVGRCHASRGEMDAARRLLSDATPSWITHSLQPLVDLWDGEWDPVERLALRVFDTSRGNGNRWDEWASLHLAARVHSLRGEPAQAAERLERALQIVDDGGARYFQMWVLPDLARARADTGRVEEARVCADRCAEILAAGEDWRGRHGVAAVADAVVLAAEGRDASARFEEALETFGRYRLPGERADALHQWGLTLARGGDRAGAREKLDEAAAIYREHGAGAPWFERLAADRAAAS